MNNFIGLIFLKIQMSNFLPVKILMFTAFLWMAVFTQIHCFVFKFPIFQEEDRNRLSLSSYSSIFYNSIQLIQDFPGVPIRYMSGRAMYRSPFRLHNSKDTRASFDTTFVLKMPSQTTPGGEGMAFILTGHVALPENSNEQYLGITNIVSEGSPIVAIEFDTRKSYSEDLDDNHVGLDVNSIYSIKQVSLSSYGVNLSRGEDVKVRIQYDTKNLTVFVGSDMRNPVLFAPLDLSAYLPELIYIGFSGSTSNFTQLNCVRSWEFAGSDIRHGPTSFWVCIMASAIGLLMLIGVFLFFYWKMNSDRSKLKDAYPSIEEAIRCSASAPEKIQLKELRIATGDFNLKNKLGKGGFGTVYKGILRNKEVAVKRISKNSSQGKQQFIAEVATIGNLNHRNLVKLIGWCYESNEFLLVSDYMPNGSLDKYIFFDQKPEGLIQESTLRWTTRFSIISGVAQALDYLHNGCEKTILHRDIKASNIMLDSEFNARLGDFGLARIIKQSQQTHHSTEEVAGTPGYMAPESFLIGRATQKTDVYAFGVLMLETACGKQPRSDIADNVYNSNVLNRLWEVYSKGNIFDGADPRLCGEFGREEMESVLKLGLACCHPDPNERPSMKTVLQVLSGEVPPPMVPTERPIFMWPPRRPGFQCLDYSIKGSQLITITELTGR